MNFFKINKYLYLLVFIFAIDTVNANNGGGSPISIGAPTLPTKPENPSTGTPVSIGTKSKTPIDTYVLGLGAVAILFAAGYSRRYYHSK